VVAEEHEDATVGSSRGEVAVAAAGGYVADDTPSKKKARRSFRDEGTAAASAVAAALPHEHDSFTSLMSPAITGGSEASAAAAFKSAAAVGTKAKSGGRAKSGNGSKGGKASLAPDSSKQKSIHGFFGKAPIPAATDLTLNPKP
jgi:hypothetical protein